jgi:hypothetical protein
MLHQDNQAAALSIRRQVELLRLERARRELGSMEDWSRQGMACSQEKAPRE